MNEICFPNEMKWTRPKWMKLTIGWTLFAAVVTALCSAFSPFLFLLVFAFGATCATQPFCNEFSLPTADIGHLSRWIVAHAPQIVNAPPGQWSRQQVSERVRSITIDILGCEKEYREDARFVQDLGLG
jgi:hypothetical protein